MKTPATTIRQVREDAKRLRQIVRVLFAAGLEQYVEAIRLRGLVPLPSRLRKGLVSAPVGPSKSVAARLREAFAALGTTFVKLGQMLSLRADIIGEEAAAEFSTLREHVPPVPYPQVVAAVERALGAPWKTHFRSIARKPLASASVAQVHRAVTMDGRAIVLKVRRPGIKEEVTRDLHILALLARLLERYVAAARAYQPVAVVREFSEWTARELDFSVEAGHIERFRGDFSDEPRMHVPTVHWELTREDLLAMDELTGVRLTDTAALRKKRISRSATARFILGSFLRQFFFTGFFHGDPHPGNLLVTTDGGLVLYDYGIMGSLPARLREELVFAFQAYARHDVEGFVKHVLDMSRLDHDADAQAFRQEMRDILDALIYRPATRRSIPVAFWRIIVAGGRYGVRFPTDLVLLAKALLTIEGVLLALDPTMDLDAALEPVFSEIERTRLDPRLWMPGFRDEAYELARTLSRLPERTEGLLQRVEEGNLSVRLDLEELKNLLDEFDRENDLRVLGIMATGMLVASALLLAMPDALPYGAAFGKIGLVAAGLLLIGTILEIRKKPT